MGQHLKHQLPPRPRTNNSEWAKILTMFFTVSMYIMWGWRERGARRHSVEMMTYMWEVMIQDCRKVAPWVKPPEALLRGGKCWLGSTATTSFSQTWGSVLLTSACQTINLRFLHQTLMRPFRKHCRRSPSPLLFSMLPRIRLIDFPSSASLLFINSVF